MEHRAVDAIHSDITAIKRFASSYRAYWGVRTDGGDREEVKDRDALRHRLHRQLPQIERIMVRAGTNGFGFSPPPIARGGPPRIGIVAVAFADEDPVYGIGGGPPCFEEVLNRLEMTLGVLESELEKAKGQPDTTTLASATSAQASEPESQADPDPRSTATATTHSAPVNVIDAAPERGNPARVFVHGVRQAWLDARAAAGDGTSLRSKIEIAAAIATIIGTVAGLGALLGWWGG